MRHVSIKAILAASAASALLLGGCATTMEMGPGYYHYDTRAAAYRAPVEPAVTHQEPVVFGEPAIMYGEPVVVYRSARPVVSYTVPYNDHGQ